MDGNDTSSTEDLSDDDLPDIPLASRVAMLGKPVDQLKPLTTKKLPKPGNSGIISSTTVGCGITSSKTDGFGTSSSKLGSSGSGQSAAGAFWISDDDDDDVELPKFGVQYDNYARMEESEPLASTSSTSVESSDTFSMKGSNKTSTTLLKTLSTTSVASTNSSRSIDKENRMSKKEEEKLRKEEMKRTKDAEKLRKKLEKEKEAAEKKLENKRKKALQPGEAHKNIVVDIDAKLLEVGEYGTSLLSEIDSLQAQKQIEPRPEGLRNTIFFWRKEFLSDDSDSKSLESFCAIFLTAKEFVAKIANDKNEKAGLSINGQTTRQFITDKFQKLKDFKMTLIIDGIEKHFRNVKTLQQREYRQRVQGNFSGSGVNTQWSDINRLDVEECKIELQLFHRVRVIQVEEKMEFASAIVRMTKAVAERPHKQMVNIHGEGLFSFHVDAQASSVKPNSLGEGLLKAWKQQLTQFTKVSDDVAAAIVAAYPSPQLLRHAFKSSPHPSLLLQDLNIRRGTGPLETSRKVGPELSKRIHKFFSAINGDEIIPM